MSQISGKDSSENKCQDLMVYQSYNITPSSPSTSDQNKFNQCRKPNIFRFNKAGKQIKILNSYGWKSGYESFLGHDIITNELFWITKWKIKYCQIESKCNLNSFRHDATEYERHNVDNFISSIEEYVINSSKMCHKNIIPYNCVSCFNAVKKKFVIVYLAQNFATGNTVSSLTKSIGWRTEGVRTIANGILEGLTYLQSFGITHNCLNGFTVFLDDCGEVRIKDFFLIPYLRYLISKNRNKIKTKDLRDLGKLLESFMPSLPSEVRKFICRCKSNWDLPRLLNDPFLKKLPSTEKICGDLSRFDTEFGQIEILGNGSFGHVVKGQHKVDEQIYAIKIKRVDILHEKREEIQKITREAKLMAKLNHKNVVRYFDSWFERQSSLEIDEIEENTDESSGEITSDDLNSDSITFFNSSGSEGNLKSYLYIKMEYCNNLTLREIINNDIYTDNKKKQSFFCQILKGLSYIHKKDIIHRDLKPENIFIKSRDIVKIGDFGSATFRYLALQQNEKSNIGTDEVGTYLYIAPELMGKASESTYNEKVDIYSLGIIFFEMNVPPFITSMERINVLSSLRQKNIILHSEMKELIWDKALEIDTKIICMLLRHKPSDRPSSSKCYSKYYTDCEKELNKQKLIPYTDILFYTDIEKEIPTYTKSKNRYDL